LYEKVKPARQRATGEMSVWETLAQYKTPLSRMGVDPVPGKVRVPWAVMRQEVPLVATLRGMGVRRFSNSVRADLSPVTWCGIKQHVVVVLSRQRRNGKLGTPLMVVGQILVLHNVGFPRCWLDGRRGALGPLRVYWSIITRRASSVRVVWWSGWANVVPPTRLDGVWLAGDRRCEDRIMGLIAGRVQKGYRAELRTVGNWCGAVLVTSGGHRRGAGRVTLCALCNHMISGPTTKTSMITGGRAGVKSGGLTRHDIYIVVMAFNRRAT
jgi:hypothetical protein